ncbi:MAG: hypothetical protein AB4080_03120 [Trichodesmium sp.]
MSAFFCHSKLCLPNLEPIEIAVKLGNDLYHGDIKQFSEALGYIGIALDLTLRDQQNQLRAKKYPWVLAKSFINH